MAKSSINIQPIKNSSEQHNQRLVELDYVLPKEHVKQENDSFITDTVENRFKTISERYQKSVGQKMQRKATPIREAVINLKEGSDMGGLLVLGAKLEKEFNIKPFQYYIHDDEGHIDNGEVKFNRHAHIVFDWTDTKTGKSLKLDRFDMSKMQDIVADSLDMERGKSSSKIHLTSLEFKIQMQERRLLYITEKTNEMAKNSSKIMQGLMSEKDVEKKVSNKFKTKSNEEIRKSNNDMGL
jgi:hypothetical protein